MKRTTNEPKTLTPEMVDRLDGAWPGLYQAALSRARQCGLTPESAETIATDAVYELTCRAVRQPDYYRNLPDSGLRAVVRKYCVPSAIRAAVNQLDQDRQVIAALESELSHQSRHNGETIV